MRTYRVPFTLHAAQKGRGMVELDRKTFTVSAESGGKAINPAADLAGEYWKERIRKWREANGPGISYGCDLRGIVEVKA